MSSTLRPMSRLKLVTTYQVSFPQRWCQLLLCLMIPARLPTSPLPAEGGATASWCVAHSLRPSEASSTSIKPPLRNFRNPPQHRYTDVWQRTLTPCTPCHQSLAQTFRLSTDSCVHARGRQEASGPLRGAWPPGSQVHVPAAAAAPPERAQHDDAPGRLRPADARGGPGSHRRRGGPPRPLTCRSSLRSSTDASSA